MSNYDNSNELRMINAPKDTLFFQEMVIKIVNRHILQNTFNILKQHMIQSRND
jgi:hypothetical protein